MRISPTERGRRHGERGFTLLELLVVVTILGLLSAAVVLAAPAGSELRPEAERLAARIQAAQEQAILANRMLALRVDGDGYAFSRRGRAGWEDVTAPPLAAARWETPTEAEPARLLLDPLGGAEQGSIRLRRGAEQWAVEIAADGEIRVRQLS